MNSRKIVETISYLFILLFVYAAVSKLLTYERFILQIGASPILFPYARPLAILVPAVELLVGIALVTEKFRLAGLYASFALMLIFTFYIITILQFSEHIPCSCGGVLEFLGWRAHLFFNVGFVVLSVVAVLLDYHVRSGNMEKNASTI
jgi:uncharacterized membrane protein YphA (DoxX/SURF4 family)